MNLKKIKAAKISRNLEKYRTKLSYIKLPFSYKLAKLHQAKIDKSIKIQSFIHNINKKPEDNFFFFLAQMHRTQAL